MGDDYETVSSSVDSNLARSPASRARRAVITSSSSSSSSSSSDTSPRHRPTPLMSVSSPMPALPQTLPSDDTASSSPALRRVVGLGDDDFGLVGSRSRANLRAAQSRTRKRKTREERMAELKDLGRRVLESEASRGVLPHANGRLEAVVLQVKESGSGSSVELPSDLVARRRTPGYRPPRPVVLSDDGRSSGRSSSPHVVGHTTPGEGSTGTGACTSDGGGKGAEPASLSEETSRRLLSQLSDRSMTARLSHRPHGERVSHFERSLPSFAVGVLTALGLRPGWRSWSFFGYQLLILVVLVVVTVMPYLRALDSTPFFRSRVLPLITMLLVMALLPWVNLFVLIQTQLFKDQMKMTTRIDRVRLNELHAHLAKLFKKMTKRIVFPYLLLATASMVSLGLAWKRLTLAEKGYHFSVLLWISIVSITPTTLVFWNSYVAIQIALYEWVTERYGPDNARVTNAGVQTYYRVRENFRTSSSKWLLIIMGNTVVSFFMLGYIAYAIGTGLVADFRAADPTPPLFDIFVFILAPLKGIESTVMFVKGVRALRKRIHSDWFGEMM